MAKYVIVTESGGDLLPEHVERYSITIVPMHVQLGDESFDDGSFPVSDVFDFYKNTGKLPKTSGCMPQDFVTAFDRIFAEDPEAHVIYLAYSAVTTCSFESAQTAVQGREDRVTSFDTKFVTAAQALIVTNVARYIEENPAVTVEEIVAFAQEQTNRARMAFIPGGLEFLRAGGRLSNGAYLGAQLLRIKPVIEVLDGKLVATKKLRGSMEKSVLALVDDFITREEMDKSRLGLIRNAGLSEDLQRQVEEKLYAAGFQELEWYETGCVISSHCGPGSFGIAGFAM